MASSKLISKIISRRVQGLIPPLTMPRDSVITGEGVGSFGQGIRNEVSPLILFSE